jgi:hypothetical protein
MTLPPHDGLAFGRAGGVDGGRLVPGDRRVLRQQPGLGLTHRGDQLVQAATQVVAAAGVQPRVGEARPRGQREVDLETAALEPVSGRLGADAVRHPWRVAQQPAVELIRSDRGDHRLTRGHGRPVGGADAGRPAVPDQDLLHVHAAVHVAAPFGDQAGERVGQAAAAADRGRIAGGQATKAEDDPQRPGRVLGTDAQMQRPRPASAETTESKPKGRRRDVGAAPAEVCPARAGHQRPQQDHENIFYDEDF